MTHRLLAAGCALLLAAAAPPAASAQVNAESFAQLGFNFSPPGARSAGMGGAFLPIADDATAAETNPAGLSRLLRPEVSFEFKGIEYSRTLPDQQGGAEFTDEVGFPSFASVVYPWERVTVTAFRHELVHFQNTVFSGGGGDFNFAPFTSEIDLGVVNWGLGGSLQLGSSLAVGVTGGLSSLDMTVDFPRFAVSEFDPAFLSNRLLVDEDADGFFLNAGLLWNAGDRISIGLAYKLRPEFDDVEYRLADADGSVVRRVGTLKIPDAVGGGIGFRATDNLTLAVDAVVNFYSQLADEQVVLYNPETLDAADYDADDGVDVHGGAEYAIPTGGTTLFLRAGAARIAASNVFYTGPDAEEAALFGTGPGDDETLFSAGAGVTLFRRLGLDVAGIFGDDRNELVASVVLFLGRGF